jgi:Carboxypeptidase regulatory-like domain
MRTITIIASLLLTAALSAETVRGKVVHPDGSTPHINVAVTLQNGSGVRSGTVYTGNNGSFYLENVPPGNYTIEFKSRAETKKQSVRVPEGGVADVPPVKVK